MAPPAAIYTNFVVPTYQACSNSDFRPRKPISTIAFSSSSGSYSSRNSIFIPVNGRRFVASSHQANYTHQTNTKKEFTSQNLKTKLLAYKKAILDGDGNAINQVEAMICTLERDKIDLSQKLSALSSEISDEKQKCIHLQADLENYRRRCEKEASKVRNDAQREVIERVLGVVDSFERAKQEIKVETENEKKIERSYRGIYKQLVEIMRSLNVAVVPSVGKAFDPAIHEAVAREESREVKEGVIIKEIVRGFFLGERLLRRAKVKVSSGPASAPAATTKPAS